MHIEPSCSAEPTTHEISCSSAKPHTSTEFQSGTETTKQCKTSELVPSLGPMQLPESTTETKATKTTKEPIPSKTDVIIKEPILKINKLTAAEILKLQTCKKSATISLKRLTVKDTASKPSLTEPTSMPATNAPTPAKKPVKHKQFQVITHKLK